MIKGIDLFCGCGGLSKGFEEAGYKIIAAFDNWDIATEVYSMNFNHTVFKANIETLDIEEYKKEDIDLVIGGPPCQDFSSAGKRDESLGRAELTEVFAIKVCEILPKWFVMENVERIKKSPYLLSVKETFKKNGYGLTEIVLDASLCGVPQKRKRYFLIGGLKEEDDFLKENLEKNLAKKSMTVREYFGDKLGVEHYYRHPRSYQRRAIFSIDEPSPTIRGVNRPIPSTYVFHKGDTCKDREKIRALTSEERMMLQTFPKDFKLKGTKTEVEQMIGNAVPVNLAKYVGNCLKEYINEKNV